VEDDSDQDVDLHAARKRKRPVVFPFEDIKDDTPTVAAGEGMLHDAEAFLLMHGVDVEPKVLAQHAAGKMKEVNFMILITHYPEAGSCLQILTLLFSCRPLILSAPWG